MDLVIIKYNAGNIQSVLYALERIGTSATVTDDPSAIRSADKVIFPGVGEASTAMDYLRSRGLDQVITSLTQPVLGICLGMQLMCSYSEENDTPCLGIFPERVRKFMPGVAPGAGIGSVLKVPQIGWNNIYDLKTPLFGGVNEGSYCYFVHGYYASLGEHTIAKTDYVQPYSSALHKGNFYGAQFHPEKSAGTGEQIIKNFLNI
jgi:imidazole glycerol-phosphate synthase subunit HisH